MTKSRIELHTIILAFLCTCAVAVIGRQTLVEYQQVKEEKSRLVLKKDICQLIEVAPYASWFRNTKQQTAWFNQAYERQFDQQSANSFLRQLITTEEEIQKTMKPMVQIVAVDEGRAKGDYTVLAYPVFDETGEFVGVGGVAIKDVAQDRLHLKQVPGVYDISSAVKDHN